MINKSMNSKRRYKIVIISSDDVTVEDLTIEQILDVKPNGADYEYKYALAEMTDEILDMKQYENKLFQWNRDNPNTVGVILRVE